MFRYYVQWQVPDLRGQNIKEENLMRNSLLTATMVLSLVSMITPASADLLDIMPAGQDAYIAFDPDAAGLARFLQTIGESPLARDMGDIGEAIGFDPLVWSEWVSALSLEPGHEIGFILNSDPDDVSSIGFYLPTSSEDAVIRFFDGITGPETNFRGVIRYCTVDDYVIVLMAENEENAAAFDPDGRGLSQDSTYRELASAPLDGSLVGTIYIRFDDLLGNHDVESGLFRAATDGPNLTMLLSTNILNPEVLRITRVLSPEAGSADFHVSEGTEGALRLNLDMPTLIRLLEEEGIVREFSMGIEEFGFESFSDFLSLFSGDVLFTIESDHRQYSAALQFGLADPTGMEDLLAIIKMSMDGTDGFIVTEFDCDGTTCYTTTAPIAPGIQAVEYGVLQNVLVIAGGCSIREPATGAYYESFVQDNGLGISSGPGLVASAASTLIRDILGMEGELPSYIETLYGNLDHVAGSLRADEGRFDLRLVLEAGNGDPASLINGLLASFAMGMFFGMAL